MPRSWQTREPPVRPIDGTAGRTATIADQIPPRPATRVDRTRPRGAPQACHRTLIHLADHHEHNDEAERVLAALERVLDQGLWTGDGSDRARVCPTSLSGDYETAMRGDHSCAATAWEPAFPATLPTAPASPATPAWRRPRRPSASMGCAPTTIRRGYCGYRKPAAASGRSTAVRYARRSSPDTASHPCTTGQPNPPHSRLGHRDPFAQRGRDGAAASSSIASEPPTNGLRHPSERPDGFASGGGGDLIPSGRSESPALRPRRICRHTLPACRLEHLAGRISLPFRTCK